MDISEKIVELIRENRISTTEVADALGKTGSLLGVTSLNRLESAVGKIKVITPFRDSNYLVHKEAELISPGDVVYIKPIEFSNVAIFGELVAKYCLLYRGAAAIVVEGPVRDTERLIRDGYPIWCMGSNPVGAVNIDTGKDFIANSQIVNQFEGGVAVCDEGGVVLIPNSAMSTTTLQKLKKIELVEDIWKYCLNTLKWSTYDIVVKKRYEYDQEAIPKKFIDELRELEIDGE